MSAIAITLIVLPLLVVAVAIAFELITKEIPNWLTLGAFVAAWPFAYFAGTLPLAVAGFFFAFAPIVIGWKQGYIGGGALKLAGAIGALTGPSVALSIVFVVGLVAVVYVQSAKRQLAIDPLANPPAPPGSVCVAIGTVLGLLATRLG